MLDDPLEVSAHWVPLDADPIGPVEVRYGTLSPSQADEASGGLLFYLRDELTVGRVTFEGLDAIRAARGEFAPYDAVEPGATNWVHVIEGSDWLRERDEYEVVNYETPLVGDYHHYLFTFHDDYVEAIAKGIWLDLPDSGGPWRLSASHPGRPLDSLDPVGRGKAHGIEWVMRRNPRPLAFWSTRACVPSPSHGGT